MQVNQDINIHNRFDIEVRDVVTGELKQEAVAHNIVLNGMWGKLCAGSAYFQSIVFGTGTGELSPSRNGLFTFLSSKPAEDVEKIKAFPISKWKRKIVLNPEEFVGSIITEVGIAQQAQQEPLTHALLKDSEGNPISITKTSTDVVTIYATVFITFVNTLPTMRLLGLPNNNSLINYLTGSGAPGGSFGLLQGEGYGERLGSTSNVSWVSDVPNRQRKTNVPRFDIGVANGDVKGLEFTNLFALAFPTPGVFTGQPYANVPLGVGDGETTEFILPSKNIIKNTLKVKKDGVITTDYTTNSRILTNFKIQNPAVLPNSHAYGVSLTPDGTLMAVAQSSSSPELTTYDWDGVDWVKRPNPAVLPTGNASGVALTTDGNLMAVAHQNSPFITTYDWDGVDWVKRPDPSVLPTGNANGVALTPDGNLMAVAHSGSPYIATYDWDGGAWAKRPNPAVLPSSHAYGVSLTPDGTLMAVAQSGSPYIATYDWDGGAWVKRPNPAVLPTGNANGVSLTADGNLMAVAHRNSPSITTYDWDGAAWVKRPDPSVLPPYTGNGVALTPDGNIMAVAYNGPSYITTYDWDGAAWVKRPDPSVLPASTAYGVALTTDGNLMAVAHQNSPSITTYDCKPRTLVVTFDTPPTVGTVLTADYTTEGVHKTINYVIDASFAIQFGEGV